MTDLYWLITLGSLGEALVAIVIVLGLVLIIITPMYFLCNDDYEKHKKFFKVSWIIWSIVLVFSIFIPSKEQLFLIYGVGGTIDYLKENPMAKQLPEKCIKALDRWANEQLKEK